MVNKVQNISILGSTGSIGRQALDVISKHPERFRLRSISAFHNETLFRQQLLSHQPSIAAFGHNIEHPDTTELIYGKDASSLLASDPQTDVFVLGISGFSALRPLLCALQNGKTVAIANKESLVCGSVLVERALRQGGKLIPVDSEQSAIFQCLQNGRKDEVHSLILTASGGPFFLHKREELKYISPEQAVAHPKWSMGRKISLDSATMFNKGLEIMEAAALFGFGGDSIHVLIHPQSIVHSMVSYRDGSMMAQMSLPDMRLAIQYALSFPERLPSPVAPLQLTLQPALEFIEPDFDRFPAIPMAYECLQAGGGYPLVYNAANEKAAELFFSGRIGFLEIEDCVKAAIDSYKERPLEDLEALAAADREIKAFVGGLI